MGTSGRAFRDEAAPAVVIESFGDALEGRSHHAFEGAGCGVDEAAALEKDGPRSGGFFLLLTGIRRQQIIECAQAISQSPAR